MFGKRKTPDAESKERKKKGLSLYRAFALAFALGSTPAALEATHIGQSDASVAERYDETLRIMRARFAKRADRSVSFETFLSANNIPSPEEVRALESLMAEFDSPARVRSGFSLARTLYQWHSDADYFPGTGANGRREHEIFIRGYRYLDRQEIQKIIAELAHAYQDEKGERMLNRAVSDHLRHLSDEFTRQDGYMAVYEDPTALEYQAHSVIEPALEARYRTLREDFRTYMRDAALRIANGDDNVGVFPITMGEGPEGNASRARDQHHVPVNHGNDAQFRREMTYEKFTAFIGRLERMSAGSNREGDTFFVSEFLIRALEDQLPSLRYEMVPTQGGRDREIHIAVTRELYEEFIAATSAVHGTRGDITHELRILPLQRQTLMALEQFRNDRFLYEMTRGGFFSNYADAEIPEADIAALREECHREDKSFEMEFTRLHAAAMAPLRTHRFTFEDYRRLADRILEYQRRKSGAVDGPELESDSSMSGLALIFNGACTFETSCRDESYGIRIRPATGTIDIHIDQNERGAHFRTVRRIFEESRRDNPN